MASKNQKELLKFLGPGYSIKEIDFGPCIYRRINARYDIEVSGAYRKDYPISVYVWDISNGVHASAVVAEQHNGISDWSALKALLDGLTRKYRDSA